MFSLIEHIEYLMMSNDCVVIPGWGALIAQYSDSFYNSEAGIINKPQRKVGFNASVNHNDGLLAQSIVRREGITYDEAVRFIADSVTTFKQQLNEGNEVSLGRLGFFHVSDGLIDFIPFYHERCNDEYFGLRSINFKTLDQIRQEQQVQQVITEVVQPAPPARRRGRSVALRTLQIAASILLLLALVPVLTTPIVSTFSNQQASLVLPSVKMPEKAAFNWDTTRVELAVALPQETTTQAVAQEQEPETEPNFEAANGSGKYYLIISSLSNEKQVKEYLGSHHDMEGKMKVLKRGKKFCIYVARDNNPTNLYKVKYTLPERYHDAWVCD